MKGRFLPELSQDVRDHAEQVAEAEAGVVEVEALEALVVGAHVDAVDDREVLSELEPVDFFEHAVALQPLQLALQAAEVVLQLVARQRGVYEAHEAFVRLLFDRGLLLDLLHEPGPGRGGCFPLLELRV